MDSWIKNKLIFVIEHNQGQLIPTYALDASGRPIQAIQNALTIFNGKKSAWAIAVWFASINGWLGDITPIEAISSNSECISTAALEEVSSSEHS